MLAFTEFTANAFSAPMVIAGGVFDGVHRGHQSLITRVCEIAARENDSAVALSFNPHPRAVLTPNDSPPLITSLPQRLELFRELGLNGCIVVKFTAMMAQMTAAEFIDFLRTEIPQWRGMIVGAGWRFGKNRSGEMIELRRLLAASAIDLEVLPPVLYRDSSGKEEKISSSRIREFLWQADFALAKNLLGRDFSLTGKVVVGRQVGRTLGCPTANIELNEKPPLSPGSYAATAIIENNPVIYPASVYWGARPTFTAGYALEAHLLGGEQNLYGKNLTVRFWRKIRDEKKFVDVAELRTQIMNDLAATRAIFKNET